MQGKPEPQPEGFVQITSSSLKEIVSCVVGVLVRVLIPDVM